jgi:hypothetical protein
MMQQVFCTPHFAGEDAVDRAARDMSFGSETAAEKT